MGACQAGKTRTTVPRASELAICSQHTLDKRCSVVGTPGTGGLDDTSGVQEENLGIETLDLHFLLVTWLEIQGRDALELVFLSHSGRYGCCKESWNKRSDVEGQSRCCYLGVAIANKARQNSHQG